MREQPRQIYTSVRTQDRPGSASPQSRRRLLIVAALVLLAVAAVVVSVLSVS